MSEAEAKSSSSTEETLFFMWDKTGQSPRTGLQDEASAYFWPVW